MPATQIKFWLNDAPVEVDGLSSNTTLLNYLRETAHCTGAKEGCAEGDCGACTVAVLDTVTRAQDDTAPETSTLPAQTYRAVNSCLVLLPMMHGKRVYTVEGLSSKGKGGAAEYHPVQKALAANLGSQCGYCTPGFVMSMFEACYRRDLDAPWKFDDQLCGNLCRCTGYRPIRTALFETAGKLPPGKFTDALREPLAIDKPRLDYATTADRFSVPTSLEELFALRSHYPNARIVCGGTDLSLEITKRHQTLPHLISVESIPSMRELSRVTHDGIDAFRVGAAMPLTDVEQAAHEHAPMLARMLRFFGSRQIKHRASMGGNICNASPIGDIAPVLLAHDAILELRSLQGVRRLQVSEFFLSYRKTALKSDEILHAIELPLLPANTRAGAYKVAKRRELDISAVSGAFTVRLDAANKVEHCRLAFGGMAATPARAIATERALHGKPWSEETVNDLSRVLEADFTPMSDHRASAWYRRTVAHNLLLGFYHETQSANSVSLSEKPSSTLELSPAGVAS